MDAPLLDTCVMVDIFVRSRARHAKATLLRELIRSRAQKVRFPMHGLFELQSAIQQERRKGGFQMTTAVPESDPLAVDAVPIDDAFVARYIDTGLPETRAGDLVFLSMAKKDALDLVTEDMGLYRNAKLAGVAVFTIDEYLAARG
jgi:predicted nucleic acid-binding protein